MISPDVGAGNLDSVVADANNRCERGRDVGATTA